jgi:quercetin dioxygenase-like cupin family protein
MLLNQHVRNALRYNRHRVLIVVAFVVVCLTFYLWTSSTAGLDKPAVFRYHDLNDNLEPEAVGHQKDLIVKRTMVPSGVVPHLTNFAQAILPPGETVKSHSHDTKYEVFHCLSGKGTVVITGEIVETLEFTPGRTIVVYPQEVHSISNAVDASKDLKFIYFGVSST